MRRVMAQENPSQLCRSSSLPARSPPAIAPESSSWSTTSRPPSIPTEPPSSITRPYRLSSPSSSASVKGFFDPSAARSSLLQRRVNAPGLSEVKAFPVERDPPPPPPRLPPPSSGTSSSSSSSSSSAYEVLQVSPKASHQEIKNSYWRLARQHHPDKVHSDRKEASAELFLQIHAAYLALKDPDARAQYDRQMLVQSAPSSSIAPQTPGFCRPSPNVFTPRSQTYTPKAATAMPNSYTPRNQFYMTPRGTTVGSVQSNVSTPRTPVRSWETDQCW